MKILQIITKSELGGAQSVLANLSNALCKHHDVTVVAGEGDGKLWEILDQRITKIPCKSLQRHLSLLKDFTTFFYFLYLRWHLQPDVVHLHSSKAGALGRLAFSSGKIVYTVHGFDSIRLRYRKHIREERWLQKFCNTIVAVSQYDADNLKTEDITQGVCTIHNGINKSKGNHQFPITIPSQYKKTVLCIARVNPPKRHDIFIETAHKLPQYAFVWIGNQEPVSHTPDNVFFLGNLPHAVNYCASADLFMLPTNYEGLPMSIIEAMSQGCPIVASDVGGIKELVVDHENGFLVNNTADEFASKIEEILGNDLVQKRMANASLQRYEEYFTAQKMVEKYEQVYNKIKTTTLKG